MVGQHLCSLAFPCTGSAIPPVGAISFGRSRSKQNQAAGALAARSQGNLPKAFLIGGKRNPVPLWRRNSSGSLATSATMRRAECSMDHRPGGDEGAYLERAYAALAEADACAAVLAAFSRASLARISDSRNCTWLSKTYCAGR